MDNYNRKIGAFGEEEACKYLEKIGYNIIDKNYYTYKGEIDIIAKENSEYVFVEVKTRTSKKYGNPIEAVDSKKMEHFIKAGKYYVFKNKLENCKIRFDIIEVSIKSKKVNNKKKDCAKENIKIKDKENSKIITIKHVKNILF